ncbi:glutamate racemase [Paenibacillus psychroresistens]|uniref:Glutamate racemase n=1 Tax=Paenibacillus psychroresistens TaxID=1778678 RepID=A0A6B8RZL8_9BACL|nr:glutamate racemase [Paenibacillus psychroresistens]QGR00367.1 glutamate racemase [Paenibacillus psychroresistens]
MKIAFFDSGLGGITVLNQAMKQLPHEDFLYFADTLHVPYGTKSKDEVNQYVKSSIDRIIQEDVKAIVIACNTATSIAVSELRSSYKIPIIGMEPAVKPAIEMNRTSGKRVLVLATTLTLKQDKYAELVSRVDDQYIVDSLPLPELVLYCESLMFDQKIITDYFNRVFSEFDLSIYGTIVLGCTHYPFYKATLQSILPSHIQIVDGSKGTIKRLTEVLKNQDQLSLHGHSDIKFLCSNNDPAYIKKMELALAFLQNEA